MASAGVGPLLAGSMGEAHHLTRSERVTLIKSARRALDGASLQHVPLIVGTGVGSTRETIEITKEAAAAGADYSIVITSGYFAGALIPNRKSLKAFFTEVAEKSPIPVMIYNCALSFLPRFFSLAVIRLSDVKPHLRLLPSRFIRVVDKMN